MIDTDFKTGPFRHRRGSQRGFTLIEVSVSLIVTIIVLLGVLALFDFSNRLTRVQTNVSDMQQSLRVAQNDSVRLIRMAGRGGLPLGSLPTGTAVVIANNVADNTHVGGTAATPEVVPGSDMLTVRGAFAAPTYQVNTANSAAFTLTPAAAPTNGTIIINIKTPTGIPQDLAELKEAVQKQRPEALLLVGSQGSDVWAVVELDPGNSNVTNPSQFTIGFKISAGTHTSDYAKLSSAGAGVFPPELKAVSFVGLLEEYRFYVRREYAVPGDKTTDLAPKLSRARVYPGTQAPWDADEDNWQVDVADNIFDFQVALGLDTPAKDPAAGACAAGTIRSDDRHCGIYESADGEADDWMYNGEATTDAALFAGSNLYYIRLSTLARADRRDKDYEAPTLVRVEDNKYDKPETTVFNSDEERMYRRRILRTVIDMRNLG
ncbi:MAG TPA: PilW family protein [Thermoanaerobaculia bacterium]|jgi:type II secretory pathway pseudopilin PulG|nr:PilW family protein [Thermoanaerobaculia bacterium]